MGWNIVRVWEHELKFPEKIVAKLTKQFEKSNPPPAL